MGKVSGSIVLGIAVIAMIFLMTLSVSGHVSVTDMGITEDEDGINGYVNYRNIGSEEANVTVIAFVDGNKIAETRENMYFTTNARYNSVKSDNKGIKTYSKGDMVFQVPSTEGTHELAVIIVSGRDIVMEYHIYEG